MGLPSCMSTPPIPIPEASHSTSNGLVKSGSTSSVAVVSLSLRFWKDYSCLGPHMKAMPFLVSSVKREAMVLISLKNLL